jgi:CheY-like chemotaxis protein
MTHSPRILIVEDQYFVAADCELQLQSAGIECVGLATTAGEAAELAQRDLPDLILMDIRLANQSDGVDAAIDIYQRLGIRCIFCSGHADAWTHDKAEPAHPLGWLAKPYSSTDLLAAVQSGLRQLEPAPEPTDNYPDGDLPDATCSGTPPRYTPTH